MTAPSESATITTFVVRFWREWSGDALRWRGRVEHVQSGQGMSFLDMKGLLDFFGRFGIDAAAAPDNLGESTQGLRTPGANPEEPANAHSEPDMAYRSQGGHL